MKYLFFLLLLTSCAHQPKYSTGDCIDVNFISHLDKDMKWDGGMYPIEMYITGLSKDHKYYRFYLFNTIDYLHFLKYPSSKGVNEWYSPVETIDSIDQNYYWYPYDKSHSDDTAKCNRHDV